MSDALNPPIYYPVLLDLRGKRCLVVGGGQVARRKVDGLLAVEAAVTVVAPQVQPMPEGVTIIQRAFQPDDLAGAALVIAATNDPAVNAQIAAEAESRGIWINVVDDPAHCTFILPAVVRRGAFEIAISTGGASPTFARRLREKLEAEFGEEYGELAALLRRLRQSWEPRALAAALPERKRKQAWEAVLDLPLIPWLREGKNAEAETAASEVLENFLGE